MTWRKYVLAGPAVFALTVALFYVEENWRGNRAWSKYKLEFEATGKSLNWADYIPSPVPDEQNFFKAPGMEHFIKGRVPVQSQPNVDWENCGRL